MTWVDWSSLRREPGCSRAPLPVAVRSKTDWSQFQLLTVVGPHGILLCSPLRSCGDKEVLMTQEVCVTHW
jgi:hypothetical protein